MKQNLFKGKKSDVFQVFSVNNMNFQRTRHIPNYIFLVQIKLYNLNCSILITKKMFLYCNRILILLTLKSAVIQCKLKKLVMNIRINSSRNS